MVDREGVPLAVQRIGIELRDFGHEIWIEWFDCNARRYCKRLAWVVPGLAWLRPYTPRRELPNWSMQDVLRASWLALERDVERWWEPRT